VSQYGHIESIEVGTLFKNRSELSKAGIHRPTQAGICGGSKVAAESIVLSGGYIDDEDNGENIIYTGHGGQKDGKQIKNQELTTGNAALKNSNELNIPVRVIRGFGGDPNWSPKSGYRYDGLYSVEKYWREYGMEGYIIWRYFLLRTDQTKLIQNNNSLETSRREITTNSIIRNSELAQKIKSIHNFTCQICSEKLNTPSGPYVEAAHIRPLGKPSNGPDIAENIICLCPNHHKLLDKGGIIIDENFQVIHEKNIIGNIKELDKHNINIEFFKWHKEFWADR